MFCKYLACVKLTYILRDYQTFYVIARAELEIAIEGTVKYI